jgi:translin
MELDVIFQEIIAELDAFDEIREKIMVLGRKGIRSCSEAIKKLHRREAGVDQLIEEARSTLKEMLGIAMKHPEVHVESYFDGIYQEFVEANMLQQIYAGAAMTPPSMLDPPIPAVQFLTGLCDVIGELRRAILDCIRNENFGDAQKYFEMMEKLHDHVNALDYPNAVIPDVRHKSDGNRKLIQATRSELTMAMHIHKLNDNLSKSSKV